MKTLSPRSNMTAAIAPRKLGVALLLACLAAGSALADVVYVTAMTSNCVSTTTCGSLPNQDVNSQGMLVFNNNGYGAFTTAKATAAGKPNTPGSQYHSNAYSNSTPASGITLAPTLGVPGGVYQVYHVYSSSAGNVSTDIVVGVTNAAGCTLSFNSTDKFQRSYGVAVGGFNTWQLLGYVTNNPGVSNPVITFFYQSGTVSAGANARLVTEVFRFNYYQPCLDIPPVGITGPLASNLNSVVVTGVSNAATKITVYQDSGSGMQAIGSITSGIVASNNTVPVSGLVKGAQVAATQNLGTQEGCVPTTGLFVGGGANPSVRVAFSLRYDPTMTGPVGSPGTTAGNVYFLGASNVLSGSAPDLGAVLHPSTNWQTVTFTRGDELNPTDPSVRWVGTGPATLGGEYGALDGLAIACEGDTGPFKIYIDHLENGTNGIVQGFEAANNGAVGYQFSRPGGSGTTEGNVLGAPDSSTVTTATAYSGTKSCVAQFQFNSTETNKWVRFVTANNVGATVNPQLQLTEPISIKILLLPPGATPGAPAPGNLTISFSGGNAVINWSGTYQLQSASKVLGPYVDVPGVTTAPYSTPASATEKYYRLRN